MKISYANKQIVTSLPGKKTYLSQRKIFKKNQPLNNWTWRPEDQWRKKDSGHQRRATETKGRHSQSTIDHGAVFAVSNTFLKMLEPEDKGSGYLSAPIRGQRGSRRSDCRTSNTHRHLCPNLDLHTWGKRPTWTIPSRTSTAAITLSSLATSMPE